MGENLMSILGKRNYGGLVTIGVKTNVTINAGGFVCTDATGYAVPGGDTSGQKFLGVAKTGLNATGLSSGVGKIKVYTRGQFKMAAASITQAMVGSPMYITGVATFDNTSSNLITCGILMEYLSATSGWLDINAPGAAATGAAGPTGPTGPAGAAGPNNLIIADPAVTMSREENLGGLTTAMALANDLKIKINAHAADAGEHATAIDNVNFPVATATATDLATLLALAGSLLTAYAAHHTDARLAAAWVFHAAQGTNYALVSAVTPTTLQEAVTRLNDLKAKYDLHDDDDTAHDTLANHAVAAANASYGVVNVVPAVGALTGDVVIWEIVDDGTGNVTKVGGVAGTDNVQLTFSADPQNDCIIQLVVIRPPV